MPCLNRLPIEEETALFYKISSFNSTERWVTKKYCIGKIVCGSSNHDICFVYYVVFFFFNSKIYLDNGYRYAGIVSTESMNKDFIRSFDVKLN